jgi:hypothetical protein
MTAGRRGAQSRGRQLAAGAGGSYILYLLVLLMELLDSAQRVWDRGAIVKEAGAELAWINGYG